jgi:FtsP/CotA-like multicopper oxidase with cupredoxin domain
MSVSGKWTNYLDVILSEEGSEREPLARGFCDSLLAPFLGRRRDVVGPLRSATARGARIGATQPIVAQRGDRVRIRYMNEGLMIHPMHLHRLPQKVIARDGHLLKRPYMGDTILVAPGERVDVLVQANTPGPWALHCHILNHAESTQGMFGMVTAMVVE